MSRDRDEWGEVAALVARAASVQFDCALRDLPRVAPLLTRDSGNAAAQFRFYRTSGAEGGFDAAHCTVKAELLLTCQRCLAEVVMPVAADAELAFVESEASVQSVPETHDPVIVEAGRVSLTALVEEELLLAMPIVPMHADVAQCRPQPGIENSEADVAAAAPKQTPFAGLRDLMKK
jgi:uncharacterized protein